MKVYRITNFIIVALVITAIYQTGELWLEGTSGHNFFYALAFFESFSWKFTTKDSGYKMFEDIKVLYICIMINKEYGNYCLLLQVIASITF